MTDPKAVDAVLAKHGIVQQEFNDGTWSPLPRGAIALATEIASLQSQLAEARGKVDRAEQRALAVVGAVQRFQPGGSPPPGDAEMLVSWILESLNTALTQGAQRWRSMAEVSDERVDSLLDELDAVARDIDSYAYGLPLMTDEGLPNMRTVVHGWLQSTADALIASQQEKTNA